MENNFEDRYQNDDIPWDHGMVDFNLVDVISRYSIEPCNAFDIGCGTGDNAIWLSQQGFGIVACDLSATAIQRAKDKSSREAADCCFIVGDFLSDPIPDPPFGFIFDRGCLHSIPDTVGRKRFVERVFEIVQPAIRRVAIAGAPRLSENNSPHSRSKTSQSISSAKRTNSWRWSIMFSSRFRNSSS